MRSSVVPSGLTSLPQTGEYMAGQAILHELSTEAADDKPNTENTNPSF